MKFATKFITLIGMVTALTTGALAASASFVQMGVDQNGKPVHIYQYTCNNGATGQISVGAKTDEEAERLAQARAIVVCEEN